MPVLGSVSQFQCISSHCPTCCCSQGTGSRAPAPTLPTCGMPSKVSPVTQPVSAAPTLSTSRCGTVPSTVTVISTLRGTPGPSLFCYPHNASTLSSAPPSSSIPASPAFCHDAVSLDYLLWQSGWDSTSPLFHSVFCSHLNISIQQLQNDVLLYVHLCFKLNRRYGDQITIMSILAS